tara:strand:+ start:6420 stop:6812 length:393 start_codon:yes stop_codon:yes gene_type:complete
MSFRIIQLENLEVFVKEDGKNISLSFNDAYIKKTMDDAEEKTLWKQNGSIELKNINNKVGIFLSRFNIASISVSYDFYTYKNILILPFSKKGDIEVILNDGKEMKNIKCNEIEILLVDKPQYIKHIKKTE